MAFESLDRGLYVVETVGRVGRLSVKALSLSPGWTPSSASRYLAHLAEAGWLERVSRGGYPEYILGPKVLELGGTFELE